MNCMVLLYTCMFSPCSDAGSATATDHDESSPDDEIRVDVSVVQRLQDLETDYSVMLMKARRTYSKEIDLKEFQFFLDSLHKTEEFKSYDTFDTVFRQLERFKLDPLNISLLERICKGFPSKEVSDLIEQYKIKRENFISDVTVQQFHKAVLARSTPVCPKGMKVIKLKVSEEFASQRTLSDVETLAKKAFKDHTKTFVYFHAIPGSIYLVWYFPAHLTHDLQRMASSLYSSEGVLEVTVSGSRVYLVEEDEVRGVTSILYMHIMSK